MAHHCSTPIQIASRSISMRRKVKLQVECLEVRSLLASTLSTAFAAQLSKLQSAVEKGPLTVLTSQVMSSTERITDNQSAEFVNGVSAAPGGANQTVVPPGVAFDPSNYINPALLGPSQTRVLNLTAAPLGSNPALQPSNRLRWTSISSSLMRSLILKTTLVQGHTTSMAARRSC